MSEHTITVHARLHDAITNGDFRRAAKSDIQAIHRALASFGELLTYGHVHDGKCDLTGEYGRVISYRFV